MTQKMLIEASADGDDTEFLYSSLHLMDSTQIVHTRLVFNIFDVIGAIGGVLDILIYMFIFLVTISE